MRALKKFAVADVFQSDLQSMAIVGQDDQFAQVLQSFATEAELRGIFVVDDERHLVGIITRSDLLDWAQAKLGAFPHPARPGLDRTMRIVKMISAATAGEVMHPESIQASVTTDTTLDVALRKMLELELIVLAVVDPRGRIVGELNLSSIFAKSLEQGKRS